MEHSPENAGSLNHGLQSLSVSQPPLIPPASTISTTHHLHHHFNHASTLALHADDSINTHPDISPPVHFSTTFRYPSSPAALIPARSHIPSTSDVYSRHTSPTPTRLEILLAPLLHADAITYTSGLAALHALYVYLKPRRVAVGQAYHGSHAVLALHEKLTGLQTLSLDCADEELGAGDVVHLETPVNPTGEALSVRKYAEKIHKRGGYLLVDSTFAPPGLQEPFALGADVVMHSGTKYLGGHSDLLCGVLATRIPEWVRGLREDRAVLGSVMGNMEAWLGVRSLRTLELRVQRQSEGAGRLVGWLDGMIAGTKGDGEDERMVREVVERVQHASLQQADWEEGWLKEQMPQGFGPVFAITMTSEDMARRLPSCLELFQHATSLGGVESLIEWRAMSDETVDPRLLRVSVGVENWQDLREDFVRGLRKLLKV